MWTSLLDCLLEIQVKFTHFLPTRPELTYPETSQELQDTIEAKKNCEEI